MEKAIKCYTKKEKFNLEDDLLLGITEKDLQSALDLIKAAKRSNRLSWKQITSILVGLGVSSAGIWIIKLAIRDPEPTSKLTLLISGGVILILTGAFGVYSSLGIKFKVSLTNQTGHGFSIQPVA